MNRRLLLVLALVSVTGSALPAFAAATGNEVMTVSATRVRGTNDCLVKWSYRRGAPYEQYEVNLAPVPGESYSWGSTGPAGRNGSNSSSEVVPASDWVGRNRDAFPNLRHVDDNATVVAASDVTLRDRC